MRNAPDPAPPEVLGYWPAGFEPMELDRLNPIALDPAQQLQTRSRPVVQYLIRLQRWISLTVKQFEDRFWNWLTHLQTWGQQLEENLKVTYTKYRHKFRKFLYRLKIIQSTRTKDIETRFCVAAVAFRVKNEFTWNSITVKWASFVADASSFIMLAQPCKCSDW